MSKSLKPLSAHDESTVHRKEDPEYYSSNQFQVTFPKSSVDWLQKIGPANVKHLKKMRLLVHAVYEPSMFGGIDMTASPRWYALLEKLAQDATGLRELEVIWDYEPQFGHLGGGADPRFLRLLGRIRGLEKVTIGGWYAREWPAYLERTMGIPVNFKKCDEGHLQSLWQYQNGHQDIAV